MSSRSDADVRYRSTQSTGGLLGGHTRFRAHSDEPRIITQVVGLGAINQVWGHPEGPIKRGRRVSVDGTGAGLDADEALRPAQGEALERYCTAVYTKDQFLTATAEELGGEALDLDTIPRCSKTELADVRCPLVAPDKKAPIRWIRGLSLLDGRLVYLPAVMVYLYTGFVTPGERICVQITTGCAAYTSIERAVLAGILEVVERDAISITWLQELSLPRIEVDHLPQVIRRYWDCYQRSSTQLEYAFFDATTDIGIPTVYGLQVSPANKSATTLVSCSAELDPALAVAKVIRDMGACRIAFRRPRQIPKKWQEFTELFHGAAYMAQASQASAFDFLLCSEHKRPLSHIRSLDCGNDKQNLQNILEVFRRKKLQVYAVELSTDEALRSGIRVVRVLIPGLQPFSFHHCARYLGHQRLYEAPKLMGYAVLPEQKLNHWPQPFA
jgi:ribosomal protein S12 methylthiotransferase accessory factor